MAGFEDLEVWQRAVQLSAEIYIETKLLRDFGFRDQITRAGLLIPWNIAQDIERTTTADKCRFLAYAQASCGEVRTQGIVGNKAQFFSADVASQWRKETKELAAMLNGSNRSIRDSA